MDYREGRDGSRHAIVMPKLNGIKMRYVPGHGCFSKDYKQWHPDKFKHISFPQGYELDGELYVHGWSLQRINSAVAINSPEVTEDTTLIQYHVYDLPAVAREAAERMTMIDRIPFGAGIRPVEWRDLGQCCHQRKMNHFQAFVARGYEGMMMKTGLYVDGRTTNLLRKKHFEDGEFKLLSVVEGASKNSNMVGALICETEEGKPFKVGTGFSNDLAIWWWANKNTARMPKKIKVQYQSFSDDGIPLNTSFLLAYYE